MPLYEYRCSDCQHEFETMQKVGARRLRKCPECGGRLEKLISRSAFLLKGGGWYSDGYGGAPAKDSSKGKGKGKKKAAKDSGSKSGSGESKDSSSTSEKALTA